MNSTSFLESERRNLEKWYRFQFPSRFMRVGEGLFMLSLIGMISFKFIAPEYELIRMMLKRILLGALLIISFTKERHEDEMTTHLRQRSYHIAILCSVLYALIQSHVVHMVESILKSGSAVYEESSAFEVMVFLLLVQIMIFRLMKKVA